MTTNISINIFQKIFHSRASLDANPVLPNFDEGDCRCEQLGFDFLSEGLTESIADKNRKIINLYQFLHKLEITDEEINSIANGAISNDDTNFLIFHHR